MIPLAEPAEIAQDEPAAPVQCPRRLADLAQSWRDSGRPPRGHTDAGRVALAGVRERHRARMELSDPGAGAAGRH